MTTWNPSDKSSGTTLSGGNLVATMASTSDGVRSTTSKSTAKNAFAISADFVADTPVASISLTGASYIGSDTGSSGIFYYSAFGWVVVYNNSFVTTDNSSPAPTASSTVVVYVDSSGGFLYASCDGNYLFGGDPSAGTGGISIAAIASLPIFASTGAGISGSAVVTANFSPTGLPSGWSPWDAAAGDTFTNQALRFM